MTGALFAVVGPSGAGKDTLMEAVQRARPDVTLVRRVITRPSAAGGENFEGVTPAEFAQRLAQKAFALHWQAHGLSYGIPASITADVAQGNTVLFNGSRTMLSEAAQIHPGLRVLHITASDAVLGARLRGRGRETDTDITRRLERARLPLPVGLDVTVIDNSTTIAAATAQMLQALDRPNLGKKTACEPQTVKLL
ncbi:MAG: phosphonate metabolism protein/1,5-bisphosphokinase (PRPP-forming) PhnN [Pelagimonas sp.]|uniref:phosphonate metabolism protein/1,5-bisphosphokinase (PRPP-forming) PhnN n=1 Tax=Pelagimonas sp. TaxID=2073170 RepID=UPI003D6AA4AF